MSARDLLTGKIAFDCRSQTNAGTIISTNLVVSLLLLATFSFLTMTSQYASATPLNIEIVDYVDNVGEHSSLAIDGQGNIHIAYYDITYGNLKYAKWNGSYWQISVIDSDGDVGVGASLALDSMGNPHVSYLDYTSFDIKYAIFNGSHWVIETVDSVGSIYGETSLALDSLDHPHISYTRNNKIIYANWNGTGWAIETVTWGDLWHSIALDSGENPHIAFFLESPSYVYFTLASKIAGTWQYKNITEVGDTGYDIALVIDDSDNPRVAYGYGFDDGVYPMGMFYANWTGSGWDEQLLEYTPSRAWWLGSSISMVLDVTDSPHIAYSGVSALRYAWWNVSSWEIEDVARSPSQPFAWWGGSSIALDRNGCVHVSFALYNHPESEHDLGHANGCIDNSPPLRPSQPSGSLSDLVDTQYSYSTNATDPENSKVKYVFDWGDGTRSYSDYVDSGVQVNMSHAWNTIGTYAIRTRAIDNHSAFSDWSNITYVSIYTQPGAPRNLFASGYDRHVNLSWQPPLLDGNSPITNHVIYRGTVSGGETFLVETDNSLTYTDSGLTNGQVYYYKVSARNLAGEGPLSAEANATPAKTPSEPLDLQATAGNTQVTLTWSLPTDDGGLPITNYTIYGGLTPGGETYLAKIGNVLTYLDAGLTNGVTYYYKVAAINTVGEGSQSLEANATPVTLPGPPINPVTSASDQQVTLSWSPPLDNGGKPIVNYTIYRGSSLGGETFLTTIGNVETYMDTGLINGRTYYYQVSAWNAVGEGPRSNEANATPATLPSGPLNLQASAEDCEVTLTWSAPASDGGLQITNYRIYRGTVPSGETFRSEIGNLLAYIDTGLVNGQTYYYKVSAMNAKGEGPRSNEAQTTPMTFPSPPRNLVARSETEQVTLTWVPPADSGGSAVVNHSIYRGTTQGSETFLVSVGNVLSYTDIGVTVGVTFYYRVSAHNVVGESQMSNEASATPLVRPTAPSDPQNLTAIAGNRRVTLTWSPPSLDGGSPISNYRVYEGTSPGNEVFMAELGNVLTFTSYGLTNGQTYYYVVKAWNAVGESVASNRASATPVTVPGLPTGLVAVAGDGVVTLSWSPPSDDGSSAIIGYSIYKGTTPGGEALLENIGAVLSYTDSGLTNGQRYYYKVAAVNAVGEGALSMEASAVPGYPSSNVPPTCTITSPSDGSTISGTVSLTGTASDQDGVVLRVEVKTGDGAWITATGTTSWSHSWDTTSVTDGQYTIRVRSHDGTDYSSERSITVTVDNVVPPIEKLTLEETLFWVVIVVLIIAIIAILVLLMRKRMGKEKIAGKPPQSEEKN